MARALPYKLRRGVVKEYSSSDIDALARQLNLIDLFVAPQSDSEGEVEVEELTDEEILEIVRGIKLLKKKFLWLLQIFKKCLKNFYYYLYYLLLTGGGQKKCLSVFSPAINSVRY